MFSKRTIIIWGIVILLLSNAATGAVVYFGTSMSQLASLENGSGVTISKEDFDYYQSLHAGTKDAIEVGDKLLISKDEYTSLNEDKETFEKVIELRKFILENYYQDFDEEQFIDGILKGLFMSLEDPYSVYMSGEEFGRFTEDNEGTYGGIGVIVAPTEDGMITVVAPIEDTPGERAGLKSGDKIIKVEGEDVNAQVMDEAVRQMRGEPGTPVNITIYRESVNDPFDVSITREEIRLKTVKSRMLNDDLGYIRISMFDQITSTDFKTNLDELLKNNPKGLVIDLRNNPGGSLGEVVEIADQLLGNQMIVYTENRVGQKREFKSGFMKVDLPMVVLVNGGSASASEILAGAVQDSNSGKIVGETTFGKGVVQTVIPLDDGSGFKLTTSQYFTPNGRNIHGIGIEPDYVIELPETYYEIEEPTDEDDNQLQKAIEVLKSQIGE